MATILAFQPRLDKRFVRPLIAHATTTARVIIFSGVRYERIPDTAQVFVKTNKKSRKQA